MTDDVPPAVWAAVRSIPSPRCGCPTCAEQYDREKATADWRALNASIEETRTK